MAALATRQHGVVTRRQLIIDLGLSPSAVDRRIRDGGLHPMHRGVYAVGHPIVPPRGRWLAAVLASGEGAVLSHQHAAAALGLMPAPGGRVHVTLPSRGSRTTRGVLTHCSRSLPDNERLRVDGLPVTTVARTLLDLAPQLRSRRLEQLINEADTLELFDLRDVQRVLARYPTRRGAARLAAVLDKLEGVGAAFTRSELELRMLELCDRHGLPSPAVNARVAGHEVDFWWPAAGVVVEVDGWKWHRMPSRREDDAAKRLALAAAGQRVVVLTWRQVADRPRMVADQLRPLVAGTP